MWLSQEAGDPFFVLAYGGLGGIVLLCSCHHFFESLSLCLRILAYQTKPGRSLQGELQPFLLSMELYLHLCGLTICPQARLASTSLLLCSKAYQTKPGRSLQGELQPFLLSMELYLHLRGLTKSIDTTPDCQNCEDWSQLVKQSW